MVRIFPETRKKRPIVLIGLKLFCFVVLSLNVPLYTLLYMEIRSFYCPGLPEGYQGVPGSIPPCVTLCILITKNMPKNVKIPAL